MSKRLAYSALNRSVEDLVKMELTAAGIDFIHNESLDRLNYRPDFLVSRDNILFLVEVDEHQHKLNDPVSEAKRSLEIQSWANDFSKRENDANVVVVRFNPHSFSIKGVTTQAVPFSQKVKRLIQLLNDHEPSRAFELLFLFFDVDEFGKLRVPWLSQSVCSGLKSIAAPIGTPFAHNLLVEEKSSRKRTIEELDEKPPKKRSMYFSIFWRKASSGRARGITVRTTNPLGDQLTKLISVDKLRACKNVTEARALIAKVADEFGFENEKSFNLINQLDWSPVADAWKQ